LPFPNSLSILPASWNHIPFSSTLKAAYHSALPFPPLRRLHFALVFTSRCHHHFSYCIPLPLSSHCLASAGWCNLLYYVQRSSGARCFHLTWGGLMSPWREHSLTSTREMPYFCAGGGWE
jgi:hypothetical protein